MVRTFYQSLLWIAWGLTVLWFSVGFAPRSVRGQETPVPVFSFEEAVSFDVPMAVPAGSSLDEFEAEPAPPTFIPQDIQSAPTIGTANAPHYWIVSSRCDVQHKREAHINDGVLDVYQRTPDGALQATDMGALSAQIVPGIPVLICVHGVFVTWNDECVESHAAYQWIRNACPQLPLQVIFFTWPSDGRITGILPTDVAIRGRQSEFNSFHLAKVIESLPESCPVSFLGHSLGCRTILSTIHLAGGGEIQGMTYPGSMGANRRYRAVLTAAALDHHWMNPKDRYGCAVARSECVVILRSRKDLALVTYPFHRLFAGRALSHSGLTRRDERKLGSLGQKVIEIDVTEYEGYNHLWPGYFTVPEIAAQIAPYLYYPGTAQFTTPIGDDMPPVEPLPSEPSAAPTLPEAPVPTPVPTAPEPVTPEPVTPEPEATPPEDDFRQAPQRQAVSPGRSVDRDRIPLFIPKQVIPKQVSSL